MRIGIIGGTGREGVALAMRWALAGHEVRIGSREATRAVAKAAELSRAIEGGQPVSGGDNRAAALHGDVVVLSVPYRVHSEVLTGLKSALAGRILVDITVPLVAPHVDRVHVPLGGSAAAEARALLDPDTKVVATLHHVSADLLRNPSRALDCDVLVCGDDPAARSTVERLIGDLGLRAISAGPLVNASALEGLTSVLLHINKSYGIKGAGIRITGLPSPASVDGVS
jgi:8-hydroxy-5-deazaflavin:NADPH oxidoreductase